MRTLLLILAVLTFGLSAFAAPASAADEAQGGGGGKHVVFIAGTPSHGFAQHEHNAGCELLAKCLREGMPDLQTKVYHNGWPTDEHALDGADAIVMYCDGGPGHMVVPHLKEVDELAKKGTGIGCIHYAVEVTDDKGGKEFLDWIGGYFQAYRSINPTWTAEFKDLPQHPVTRGVHPFSTHDEWYYHMRFRENMQGVTPILSAVPPKGLRGTDPAHNGNAEVHDPSRSEPEVVLWVSENPQTHQRGFGLTGGHYHFNWAQDQQRKVVLNCIAWIARAQVPPEGVESKRPTADDLLANLDKKKVPADFSKEKLQRHIEEMNQGPGESR